MSPTIEQLKTTLRNLPSDDRAELADYLLQTLSGETADIKSEWLALAQQRITEIRAGKIVGIPAEKVLQDLLESKP